MSENSYQTFYPLCDFYSGYHISSFTPNETFENTASICGRKTLHNSVMIPFIAKFQMFTGVLSKKPTCPDGRQSKANMKVSH